MWRKLRLLTVLILIATTVQVVATPEAQAANVTVPADGIVTVELLTSFAGFSNTLSIGNAGVAIAESGCSLEPAVGLTGLPLMSEKQSQRGCRVILDADSATGGIQPFTAGTELEFRMCAQIDADGDCEFVWSSDPSANSDGEDHVRLSAVGANGVQMAWEDLEDLGDEDFDDLIAVVRVQTDRDGDALWDDWETNGVDVDGDGVIDVDLPALGADPDVPDIFIEIDYMDCTVAGSDCAAGDTHNHRPKQAAVDAVIDSFAAQGITLHIDIDDAIAHQTVVAGCPLGDDFDTIKADPANFGPDNPRRFTHHYALFAHRISATASTSGCGELPGNDFIVSLGDWNTSCIRAGANNTIDTVPANDDIIISGILRAGPDLVCDSVAAGDDTTDAPLAADLDGDGIEDRSVGTVSQQAGTLMHELGHNLDLRHGGDDNVNFKPNYLSVMNYSFQSGFLDDPDGAGPLIAGIDYSGSVLGALNENSLSEMAGIGGVATQNTRWRCPGGPWQWDDAEQPIDWNCDTTISGTPSVDSNNSGAIDVLTGHDDWGNIRYDFQNMGDFEDGVHDTTIGEPEPTSEDWERFDESRAADLAVTMTASVDPVESGATSTLSITVENTGVRAAEHVEVDVALPAGVVATSCQAANGTCGGTPDAPTVTYESVEPDAVVSIALVVEIECATPDGTEVTASVAVTAEEDDLDPSDNEASTSLTVLNPPPVIENLETSRTSLWPPNHRMRPIDLSYDVIDNCGDHLVDISVTSNQPINGPGDGNTDVDWLVLGPTAVELRAERSQGRDRIYTIQVEVTDEAGSTGDATTTVTVGR